MPPCDSFARDHFEYNGFRDLQKGGDVGEGGIKPQAKFSKNLLKT